MTRRNRIQVALALAVLAALGVLVLWFVLDSKTAHVGVPDEGMPVPRGTPVTTTGTELSSVNETPGKANAPVPAERTIAKRDPRVADAPVDDSELAHAIWIEGRVELAPGTPLDEEAWVVAKGRTFERRPLHRARVGSDGRFRVAFEPSTKTGWLALSARYDYLPQEMAIRLAKPPQDIVLKAMLGGCVRGRILLPASAQDRAPDIVLARVGGGEEPIEFFAKPHVEGRIYDDLRYEVGGLPAGQDRHLSLRSKEFLPLNVDGVGIAAGEVTLRDLEPVLGTRISGRVTSAGTPIAEALVQIVGIEEHRSWMDQASLMVRTGADGAFELTGLGRGDLTLIVQKSGLAPATLPLGTLEVGTRKDNIAVALTEGQSISGKVLFADGKPAPHALVDVEETWVGERQGETLDTPPTECAADGSFRVTGLTQTLASVSARAWIDPESAPDAAASTPAPEANAAGKTASKPRPIRKRGTPWSSSASNVAVGTADLVLTLTKGDAIRGRVIDSEGKPVERFTVTADPDHSSTGCADDLASIERSFRDKDGRFEMEGLKPCTWDVSVTAKGALDSATTKVQMPGARPLEIRMLRTAQLAGVVVGPDQKPVENAQVICMPDTRDWSDAPRPNVRTDAEGAFRIRSAPIGPVRIFARATGLADSQILRLDVGPGATRSEISLVLRAGATLIGRVARTEGAPEVSYRVFLQMSDGSSRDTRTGADGEFRFEALTPGSGSLQAWPSTTSVFTMSEDQAEQVLHGKVTLREGETTRVELGAKTTRIRVHGRVVGPADIAGNSLSVTALGSEGGRQHETSITKELTYEVTVPGPGEYMFAIQHDAAGTGRFRVTVPQVAELEHDLVLPAGSIRGRVVDGEGARLNGVRVRLLDSRPREAGDPLAEVSVETGEDGSFSFRWVAAGTYALEAAYASPMAWEVVEHKPGRGSKSGVVVTEGETTSDVEIVLARGTRITGTIRGPSGSPMPGVDVFAFDAAGHVMDGDGGQSDNAGRFALGDVPAGRVLLYARTPTSAGKATATAHADADTEIDVVLGVAGELRVRVLDAAGAPVHASLEIVDADGRHFEEVAPLDALGEALAPGARAWPGMPIGKFAVRARGSDGTQAAQEARVSDGQVTEVVLRLAP